jgi:UDP-N-acetylmuramoylalanine--D-glutamate ligase
VLLNLSSDHLDRYDSYDDYVEAKARIFLYQGDNDFAVLNADDDDVTRLADRGRARVLTFSRRGRVVSGSYAETGEVWTAFGGATHRLLPLDEIRLPGPHNLENALAATSIVLAMGGLDDAAGRSAVISGLREFAGLEHRLEFCGELEGRRFFNDSKATNVASLRQALFSLPQPLTLIAGGRDKHGDFSGLTKIIEERVGHLVLIGEAADTLSSAWRGVSQDRAGDMDGAVLKAFGATPSGGVIALSPGCASYDMFRDYEERGRQFKLAVKRLIRKRGAGGRS